MESTLSLAMFGLGFSTLAWIGYVTYEPIRKWAWSDVEQNKKTHGSGSFRKNKLL
ncbi:hypothetical protein ABEY48_30035 [Bacillus mycoides]|uniref:hypothetical protein n=1 Tax=Bacillus cereus group TaxID=86661 RepID=UPI0022E19CA9|nr:MULTISPECIES: hypothetical protein [Bacillus cereus group]MDA1677532.1 hypothetical protein [Bacillus cereus group sp. TH152-1LC]MDA1774817.1 hypothetical protein [Bacillus cereus]MEC2555106.1 hypothetical protein [Bacillus tropicus]MED3469595.1 hypothetical protein [Bacillus thuringiensis]